MEVIAQSHLLARPSILLATNLCPALSAGRQEPSCHPVAAILQLWLGRDLLQLNLRPILTVRHAYSVPRKAWWELLYLLTQGGLGASTACPGRSYWRGYDATEPPDTTRGQCAQLPPPYGLAGHETALVIFVDIFRALSLIEGEPHSTDSQLETSSARFKGCAYYCQDC